MPEAPVPDPGLEPGSGSEAAFGEGAGKDAEIARLTEMVANRDTELAVLRQQNTELRGQYDDLNVRYSGLEARIATLETGRGVGTSDAEEAAIRGSRTRGTDPLAKDPVPPAPGGPGEPPEPPEPPEPRTPSPTPPTPPEPSDLPPSLQTDRDIHADRYHERDDEPREALTEEMHDTAVEMNRRFDETFEPMRNAASAYAEAVAEQRSGHLGRLAEDAPGGKFHSVLRQLGKLKVIDNYRSRREDRHVEGLRQDYVRRLNSHAQSEARREAVGYSTEQQHENATRLELSELLRLEGNVDSESEQARHGEIGTYRRNNTDRHDVWTNRLDEGGDPIPEVDAHGNPLPPNGHGDAVLQREHQLSPQDRAADWIARRWQNSSRVAKTVAIGVPAAVVGAGAGVLTAGTALPLYAAGLVGLGAKLSGRQIGYGFAGAANRRAILTEAGSQEYQDRTQAQITPVNEAYQNDPANYRTDAETGSLITESVTSRTQEELQLNKRRRYLAGTVGAVASSAGYAAAYNIAHFTGLRFNTGHHGGNPNGTGGNNGSNGTGGGNGGGNPSPEGSGSSGTGTAGIDTHQYPWAVAKDLTSPSKAHHALVNGIHTINEQQGAHFVLEPQPNGTNWLEVIKNGHEHALGWTATKEFNKDLISAYQASH